MKLTFDRSDYLEFSEAFENNDSVDIEHELSEFNGDIDDIANELACTRYELAKQEAENKKINDLINTILKQIKNNMGE